ncbi:IS256 family transposase [Brevibacterium aurantiacum]|uniref:Mutator family transposase n=1 Tax=Brevibacterium aurantiacum TaxID=273384 RepID=A0A3Q9NUA9_BREAU|nr:IS256 family transposase [Brevibacterium aurantiacum]AZT95224.1 IS256 family transposase [Brevibacterium aurantiacum]AZT95235.1 IS256 family transposase [Brevibacterium aurantiacum]AZT95279.1 IS256 family transposase [Brevibacterium aurantiacum]AZT95298.1 IS256 family transposase [Brevibacterium aurantiacum]AZT95306.1 IS256 family transposase [Brevibacterium aurantiacum]
MTNTHSNPNQANEIVDQLKASGALDELFSKIDSGEVELTGDGGLVPALIKETLERGLGAEMTSHLGYTAGDRDAKTTTNSRNGTYAKTVASEAGDIEISVPRDRDGSFTPRLVPKGSRRLGGLDDMIISLYAGGMTIRDIQHHLVSTIGTELSHETISNITDAVLDAVMEWQQRPLEEFYPVVYLDAIRVKVRDNGHVRSKAAHIAVGVDMDGIKHVLGIWVQNTEGASFWAHVCAELANRGVQDVLIVCCDGLTGLPDAIEATWPDSLVQTCVVHLIRAANRFVSYTDRKAVSRALKPIYAAANEEAALTALTTFAESELGRKYPSAVAVFENAWDRFIPFLQFPPALRRVIYTTNAIESLNYQLRKVTKNRSQFPTDDSVVKLLWLAICNIEDKRAREREKEKGKGKARKATTGRLVEGQITTNWKQALAQLAVAYPDRMNPYL